MFLITIFSTHQNKKQKQIFYFLFSLWKKNFLHLHFLLLIYQITRELVDNLLNSSYFPMSILKMIFIFSNTSAWNVCPKGIQMHKFYLNFFSNTTFLTDRNYLTVCHHHHQSRIWFVPSTNLVTITIWLSCARPLFFFAQLNHN